MPRRDPAGILRPGANWLPAAKCHRLAPGNTPGPGLQEAAPRPRPWPRGRLGSPPPLGDRPAPLLAHTLPPASELGPALHARPASDLPPLGPALFDRPAPRSAWSTPCPSIWAATAPSRSLRSRIPGPLARPDASIRPRVRLLPGQRPRPGARPLLPLAPAYSRPEYRLASPAPASEPRPASGTTLSPRRRGPNAVGTLGGPVPSPSPRVGSRGAARAPGRTSSQTTRRAAGSRWIAMRAR